MSMVYLCNQCLGPEMKGIPLCKSVKCPAGDLNKNFRRCGETMRFISSSTHTLVWSDF